MTYMLELRYIVGDLADLTRDIRIPSFSAKRRLPKADTRRRCRPIARTELRDRLGSPGRWAQRKHPLTRSLHAR
jgi:hypothetical protein